jgi:hypothetical protein
MSERLRQSAKRKACVWIVVIRAVLVHIDARGVTRIGAKRRQL